MSHGFGGKLNLNSKTCEGSPQCGDPIGLKTEIVFSGVDLIPSGRRQKLSIEG